MKKIQMVVMMNDDAYSHIPHMLTPLNPDNKSRASDNRNVIDCKYEPLTEFYDKSNKNNDSNKIRLQLNHYYPCM